LIHFNLSKSDLARFLSDFKQTPACLNTLVNVAKQSFKFGAADYFGSLVLITLSHQLFIFSFSALVFTNKKMDFLLEEKKMIWHGNCAPGGLFCVSLVNTQRGIVK